MRVLLTKWLGIRPQVTPVADAYTNTKAAEEQAEYNTLPLHRVYGDDSGSVVVTYSLTFWERLSVLFKGRLYLTMLTFGNPITPIRLELVHPATYSYLPLDVISIEHNGEQFQTRLKPGQAVYVLGEWLTIEGFVEPFDIICRGDSGKPVTYWPCDFKYDSNG